MKRLKVLQDSNIGVVWVILKEDELPISVNQFSSFKTLADFEVKENFSIRLSGFLNPCVEVWKIE